MIDRYLDSEMLISRPLLHALACYTAARLIDGISPAGSALLGLLGTILIVSYIVHSIRRFNDRNTTP